MSFFFITYRKPHLHAARLEEWIDGNTHGKHLKHHQMIAASLVEDYLALLALLWERTCLIYWISPIGKVHCAVVSQQRAEASYYQAGSRKRSARPGIRSYAVLHQAGGGRCDNGKGVILAC